MEVGEIAGTARARQCTPLFVTSVRTRIRSRLVGRILIVDRGRVQKAIAPRWSSWKQVVLEPGAEKFRRFARVTGKRQNMRPGVGVRGNRRPGGKVVGTVHDIRKSGVI